jgi:aminoglycoside phosphotransferase (APT) family kinase protein
MTAPSIPLDRAPEFDADKLDRFLRAAAAGLEGPMALERIAGGQSNPTFFVTYDTRRLVLRKQPPGELLPSAHAIDREYRVMGALREAGVLVPTVVLYCDDRDVIGTPFYIMDRLEGRVFHDGALPGVSGDERRLMYRSLAQALAALHNVDRPVSACRTTGRAETTSPARSHGGPGSGSFPARGRMPTSSG